MLSDSSDGRGPRVCRVQPLGQPGRVIYRAFGGMTYVSSSMKQSLGNNELHTRPEPTKPVQGALCLWWTLAQLHLPTWALE